MPVYEYLCPQCKNVFELRLSFVQFNSSALCSNCNSIAERLISTFACKTGGNIQAPEKAFRKESVQGKNAPDKAGAATSGPSVLITPPPDRIELLSPPKNRSTRTKRKKK